MTIKGIIGKKLGMSTIYDADGKVQPVTVIQAGPCIVTQVKTLDNDGYNAVQIGFSEVKKINSPQSGHQERSGGKFSTLQEFEVENLDEIEVGQSITSNIFVDQKSVKVTATTKAVSYTHLTLPTKA